MKRDALAAELIHHRENSEVSAVGLLVGDEVHRPALVHLSRLIELQPRLHRHLTALAGPYLQTFLAVEAVDQLVVCLPSFSQQQHVQASIAESGP